jgi:hypothetical protein
VVDSDAEWASDGSQIRFEGRSEASPDQLPIGFVEPGTDVYV